MTGFATVAVAIGAAGCTDGSEAAPLTTVAPTTPATVDTPPPTEATTTTTTTTTTIAPTTTVGPETIKADVEADFRASRTAFDNAAYELDDPSMRDIALAFSVAGGDAAARANALFDGFLAAGERVRPNPEIPNRIDVFEIELVDETTAIVDYCRIDADIIFEPDGLGQGIELIINDGIVADRVNTTMKLEENDWKVLEGQRIERYEGETACPES